MYASDVNVAQISAQPHKPNRNVASSTATGTWWPRSKPKATLAQTMNTDSRVGTTRSTAPAFNALRARTDAAANAAALDDQNRVSNAGGRRVPGTLRDRRLNPPGSAVSNYPGMPFLVAAATCSPPESFRGCQYTAVSYGVGIGE